MGLVFEKQQPRLFFSVDSHVYANRAGVYLVRQVKSFQPAAAPDIFGSYRSYVHKRDGLVPAQLLTNPDISVISGADTAVRYLRFVYYRGKSRVAAMIGPIGIDHAKLGKRGVAPFGYEVIPAESQVIRIHGKRIRGDKRICRVVRHFREPVNDWHPPGRGRYRLECVGLFRRGLAAVHRIDDMLFEGSKLIVGNVAGQDIHPGGANERTGAARNELHALCGRIGPLVELAGQILGGEHRAVGSRKLKIGHVDLRLRKNGGDTFFKYLPGYSFYIIAIYDSDALYARDGEEIPCLVEQRARFAGVFRFAFDKDPVYHRSFTVLYNSMLLRRCPCGSTRLQNLSCARPNMRFQRPRPACRPRR